MLSRMENKVNCETPVCLLCGKAGFIEVDEYEYEAYISGALTKFEFLSMIDYNYHEQFLNGTHEECLRKIKENS